MARWSQPHWSEWRESGAVKRDMRHDASQPDRIKPLHQTKNTKKWCKGKVGRPHQWQRSEKTYFGRFVTVMWTCSQCSKQHHGRKAPDA